MTVSNVTVKNLYNGDGINTTFAIPFDFLNTSEIKVYLRDNSVSPATQVLQVNAVDYNLTGGPPVTNVEMVAAPSAQEQLLVIRENDLQQNLDLPAASAYPPESIESQLDKMARQIQELDEKLARAFTMQKSSSLTDANTTFPQPESGKYMRWKSSLDGLENADVLDETDFLQVAQNTSDIAALDVRVTAAEGNITTLQTNNSTQDGRLTALEGNDTAQDATLVDHENRISQNETNIAAIVVDTAQITTNKNNIATNTANIATNTTNIGTNTTNIASNASDILALQNRLTVLENTALLSRKTDTDTIVNNQAVALDINNMTLNSSGALSAVVQIEIERNTSTTKRFTTGNIHLQYKNSNWELEWEQELGDLSGVTFSVTTVGGLAQVQYTSDNMSGTGYTGKIKYLFNEISALL